jgi:gamma-butyrobetaine dioxygenase
MTSAFDRITDLFAAPGAFELYGEDVTIAEHMMQTAALAVAAGAEDRLVLAALLHDVGHLVDDPEADALGNRHHAEAGAALVEPLFGPAVARPIALHVAAKRYLVATDPDYRDRLSAASVATLQQQGGPFDADERQRFRSEPDADAATDLRRWDDTGKVPGVVVAPLSAYRPIIDRLAR